MNEASALYSRGKPLTKEQKKQAEEVIYGVPRNPMDSFSSEEIERMRQIISAHDTSTGANKIKEFDLNKPPAVPYTHQPFPAIVYAKDGSHKIVKDANDMKAALASGYKERPWDAEPEQEAELATAGRPRKVKE